MNLTIAYITGRKDPKFLWFYDSLENQLNGEKVRLIFVSLDAQLQFNGKPRTHLGHMNDPILAVPPKPNVWQGPHRLTKEDWWAMSNARNTALCLTQTDYLVYVDDLSVLLPGWLDAVKEAMAGNYIVCGAYRKVKKLVVENGEIQSYEPYADDTRLSLAPSECGPCTGDWLYGCSCGFPTEALLSVGGWPEYVDGLGAEDYTLGIALQNAGFHLKYDKRMMTYEDEDLHHTDRIKKSDKGVSPNDKSHAALNIAKQSDYFPNYYPGGMRELRSHVLSGNPFPVIQQPQHDWFDNQPISEM